MKIKQAVIATIIILAVVIACAVVFHQTSTMGVIEPEHLPIYDGHTSEPLNDIAKQLTKASTDSMENSN